MAKPVARGGSPSRLQGCWTSIQRAGRRTLEGRDWRRATCPQHRQTAHHTGAAYLAVANVMFYQQMLHAARDRQADRSPVNSPFSSIKGFPDLYGELNPKL